MTADDIPKDAPLLRCWLKKSWSTSKKVGLWLVISAYVACIAAIPPLVFWGSVIVGVIAVGVLGYSLVWCMARNLQDSDWGSDTATAITSAAITFALTALAAIAFAAIAIAFAAIAFLAITFAAIAITFAAIAIAFAAIATEDKSSMWYYAFRFLGAYLNYRNRIKATSTTSVVEETKE